MKIIFIHQNMPGQYRSLIPHFASVPENEVIGIGEASNIQRNVATIPERLKLIGYKMPAPIASGANDVLRLTNEYFQRGECVARILVELKNKGFIPDVICCHPGWGESLYIKDVYPNVRLINYCEFYYHSTGQDFGFDPEFPEKPQSEWGLRTRNAPMLLSLNSMDLGLSPTEWQATRYPEEYRKKISVVHDGVKTDVILPDDKAFITLKEKDLKLTVENEVITFVNRNFEPYRGFHVFMRALPEILLRRPNAHIVLVGGDEVSYGKRLHQMTYRQWMLNQVGAKLDMSRVHFVGRIPYVDYIRLLQISTAHVYLTYPFVLSWSMLEAMSAGCLVIGSRTPPVEEVIQHEKNGLLVDFFSQEQLVEAVERACKKRHDFHDIRAKARQTIIEKYDYNTICFPQQAQLIEKGHVLPLKSKTILKAPEERSKKSVPVAAKKCLKTIKKNR